MLLVLEYFAAGDFANEKDMNSQPLILPVGGSFLTIDMPGILIPIARRKEKHWLTTRQATYEPVAAFLGVSQHGGGIIQRKWLPVAWLLLTPLHKVYLFGGLVENPLISQKAKV